jgi:hypothetical protein
MLAAIGWGCSKHRLIRSFSQLYAELPTPSTSAKHQKIQKKLLLSFPDNSKRPLAHHELYNYHMRIVLHQTAKFRALNPTTDGPRCLNQILFARTRKREERTTIQRGPSHQPALGLPNHLLNYQNACAISFLLSSPPVSQVHEGVPRRRPVDPDRESEHQCVQNQGELGLVSRQKARPHKAEDLHQLLPQHPGHLDVQPLGIHLWKPRVKDLG